MSEKNLKHTTLVISERKMVKADGVENVVGFDESYVSLSTTVGQILVEGKGLKIENLSKESGEIEISGEISGILYAEQKSAKGVFARIFK